MNPMVSDSYGNMMSDVAIRSMLKNPQYGEELEVLIERERELSRLRSGSAPPTVEGSLTAVGGLFDSPVAAAMGIFGSEEELRADPGYANYYYSNANLNPRLPPPLVSKEDWRFSQRLKGLKVGGIGDRRRGCDDDGGDGDRSLFCVQPGFDGKDERKSAVEWGGNGDGLIGLPAMGLGSRQRSYVEVFQVTAKVQFFNFWCF